MTGNHQIVKCATERVAQAAQAQGILHMLGVSCTLAEADGALDKLATYYQAGQIIADEEVART